MPCYRPLAGLDTQATRVDTGKRIIKILPREAWFAKYTSNLLALPCGQCIGCRLERSRQWAIRCVHEAQMHKKNCFITLTYNDEHLPYANTLVKRDFQLFMKRLRKAYGAGIRYYMCGEYGDKFARPHYHAILFNMDFPDRQKWKFNKETNTWLDRSNILDKLWTNPETRKQIGYTSVGQANFETAAYVARYVTKKITGAAAEDHYIKICKQTGLCEERLPEYNDMSRRPGVGSAWLNAFMSDVFPSDEVIIRGKKMKPPKYYDSQYELLYPGEIEKIKAGRKDKAKQHASNNTLDRLQIRETIQEIKAKRLLRRYENEG